jgi:hypothetical protein
MTLARFRELLDAYGARSETWPSAERGAAESLLRESAEAQQAFSEAEPLDAWLDDHEVPEISPTLRARVLEVPIVATRKRRAFGWRLAWAFTFSCVIGVASGALTAPEASADDEEWAELTEVSFYANADMDFGASSLEEGP